MAKNGPRLEGCVSRNLFTKADRILKLMKDVEGSEKGFAKDELMMGF